MSPKLCYYWLGLVQSPILLSKHNLSLKWIVWTLLVKCSGSITLISAKSGLDFVIWIIISSFSATAWMIRLSHHVPSDIFVRYPFQEFSVLLSINLSGCSLFTVAHNCHIKTKCSQQIQIAHSKFKLLTAHLLWAIWNCCEHLVLMWQLWATVYSWFKCNELVIAVSVKRTLQTADLGWNAGWG